MDACKISFSQVFMLVIGAETPQQMVYNMEKELAGTWVKYVHFLDKHLDSLHMFIMTIFMGALE